jgi:hypothetical protein
MLARVGVRIGVGGRHEDVDDVFQLRKIESHTLLAGSRGSIVHPCVQMQGFATHRGA